MVKKYKVGYTWHSGETFGAKMKQELTIELEEEAFKEWKKCFTDDKLDGSYNTIDYIREIND